MKSKMIKTIMNYMLVWNKEHKTNEHISSWKTTTKSLIITLKNKTKRIIPIDLIEMEA